MRPSAFGPPRPSATPPPAPASRADSPVRENEITARYQRAEPQPAARERPAPQAPDERAAPAASAVPPEPHARVSPTFATALASLRPSWRETLHARVRPTLFSIAVFSCMLALSGVTLLRYALPGWSAAQAGDEARPAAARQAPRPVRDTAASAPQPRVLEAGEQPAEPPEPSAASAQAPAEEIQSLLRQGDRALLRRNPHEAQQAFERILELDQINARAADGLARVRLAQGDLNGAESWIRVAIKRRPRRAAYHALYAEILATLGREEEALEERLKAASGLAQPAESEPDQREE